MDQRSTKLALAIEGFGQILREVAGSKRARGDWREYYRALAHMYGQLGRILYLTVAVGEIDPQTSERITATIAPELKEALSEASSSSD